MLELSASSLLAGLELKLGNAIRLDVELIKYTYAFSERMMYCHMTMRNGFVLEGSIYAKTDNLYAREMARKLVLTRVIMIEQYLLADKLYAESVIDNSQRRLLTNKENKS